MKTKISFLRFSQFLLLYTLLVILWGAWVRISHSGDGCGASWPLCQGQLLPEAPHAKTWVELSHRLTSGLFGLLVIFLFWQARKLFPKQSPLRKATLATLIFMISEALLGAKLVLFGLVGGNDSPLRLFVMGLHQVNSLLLSGSVALVVLFASELPAKASRSLPGVTPKTHLPPWTFSLFLFFLVIAVTGAFASLAATLFPSSSLMEGIAKDFSANAHYLLRLRILHPIMASLIAGGMALYFWLQAQNTENLVLKKVNLQVALSFIFAIVFGYVTLLSLAPLWMKVTHLLIAHLLWMSLLRWYALRKITS